MVCDTEEVSSESSRKMQEETTSEASWAAMTKGKGKEAWRVEPGGETEKPEVTALWNEAEGVSVNPEGESHHEETRAKITRRMEIEMRRVKRVRIQRSKKKVIRVESEETQDYVRESLNLSREEAEEISFVPSTISISQRPMFWCENRWPSVSGSLLR